MPTRSTLQWGVVGLLAATTLLLSLAPLGLPSSYSWLANGTSESAAQGVDGAWVARSGFVTFGVAVLWLTVLNANRWRWPGAVCHTVFGLSMLGVAAFSHQPWLAGVPYSVREDQVHSIFASLVGFGFIAGVAAVMIARRPPSWRRAAPDGAVLLVTVTVPLLMDSSVWGILQRVMFLAAACWYAGEALSHPGALDMGRGMRDRPVERHLGIG
ncbi:MAG: DUF998 domain-containing protein [Ornithinimicrobium sp.]